MPVLLYQYDEKMTQRKIFLLITLLLLLELQSKAQTIILYTMSPYFGPTECERKVQEHFGFIYSASSHLNNRQFRIKNKKSEKLLIKRNGVNWKEEYKKMVNACQFNSWEQVSIPIDIKWVSNLSGNFSFTKNWSYPLGVEMKEDGKAGCGDGGFCPERCYTMLDSNGIVLKDSSQIFYQLLDTTHQFHTIQCEAECYEWAGTDFIEVIRNKNDSVFCYTTTGLATHCSLQLVIFKNSCTATIDLNSITPDGSAIFYCTGGNITIDRKLWKKGVMKSEFNFSFENGEKPFYWKGKIYAKIKID